MQIFYFSYLKLYKCRVYYRRRKKKSSLKIWTVKSRKRNKKKLKSEETMIEAIKKVLKELQSLRTRRAKVRQTVRLMILNGVIR